MKTPLVASATFDSVPLKTFKLTATVSKKAKIERSADGCAVVLKPPDCRHRGYRGIEQREPDDRSQLAGAGRRRDS